jgi:hypothetical protein
MIQYKPSSLPKGGKKGGKDSADPKVIDKEMIE